jgi:hypothetical protein
VLICVHVLAFWRLFLERKNEPDFHKKICPSNSGLESWRICMLKHYSPIIVGLYCSNLDTITKSLLGSKLVYVQERLDRIKKQNYDCETNQVASNNKNFYRKKKKLLLQFVFFSLLINMFSCSFKTGSMIYDLWDTLKDFDPIIHVKFYFFFLMINIF